MLSSIPHGKTDPWILLAPSEIDTYGEKMFLSPVELTYQSIPFASKFSVTFVSANGTTTPPITPLSFDPLNQVIPMDEGIREIMRLEEQPWEDSHHHVSIFDSNMIPLQILSPEAHEIISSLYTTIQLLDSEGNRGNISQTLLPNIFVMTGIMENIQSGANHNLEEIVSFTCPFMDFHDVFPWSYEEMHGLDPSIVKHEIKKSPLLPKNWYGRKGHVHL